MRRLAICLLLGAAASAACGDAGINEPELPDGCDSPRACQVAGVDLVVERPELLPGPGGTDPVSGLLVFGPDASVSYVLHVWNRGDRASTVDTITVGGDRIEVPPLAPGRAFSDTLTLRAPTNLALRTDTTRIWVALVGSGSEDPFFGNDASFSDPFIVTLPVLRAELVFPDTVREEVPFSATVTVRNDSRFAASEPQAMAFCMFDFDVGCGSWAGAAYHLMALPALAPGESWTRQMTVIVPAIDERHYATWSWDLFACVMPAGSALMDFHDWSRLTCLRDSRRLHVLEKLP